MGDGRDAAVALVRDRPRFREELAALLDATDGLEDGWTFDDVPLDSGVFGELVSRGVVEEAGDGYRIVDREGVAAVASGDAEPADADDAAEEAETDGAADSRWGGLPASVRGRGRGEPWLGVIAALVGAVALWLRWRPASSVYRGDDVLLLANDPWLYLYRVETVLAAADGPFGVLASDALGGAPLVVASNAVVAAVLGGVDAAAEVLAVSPVVAGLVTVALAGVTAARLRGAVAGVGAAAFLAVAPIHVTRTAVGYADHHPFDYLWIAVTLVALVGALHRSDWRLRERACWLVAGTLAVGVAGQMLSWAGGALYTVPLAGAVAVAVAVAVRDGDRALGAVLPIAVGLGIATATVAVATLGLGWRAGPPATAAVPAGLAVGTGGLALAADRLVRRGRGVRDVLALEAGAAVAAVLVVLAVPPLRGLLLRGVRYFSRTSQQTAEAFPLVLPDPTYLAGFTFSFHGPFLLALGLAAAYSVGRRLFVGDRIDGRVLAVGVYGVFFGLASLIQVRFAGELALLLAVVGGVVVARWASRLVETVGSSRRVVAFVLIVAVATPTATGVPGIGDGATAKFDELVVPGADHEAADWMRDHADRQGLRFPENYVLSEWGLNRMYNYVVSERSLPRLRYDFARTNYVAFLRGTDAERWYQRFFMDRRRGYLAIGRLRSGDAAAATTNYATLYRRYGSAGERAPGTGRYRWLHSVRGGAVQIYRVVPGATVTANVSEAGTVEVVRASPVGPDDAPYRRRVRPENGSVSVRVAYPGSYRVGAGDVTASVTESDVTEGRTVAAETPSAGAAMDGSGGG